MADLIRSYGKGLTAVLFGLTVIWILGFIVLPQASMVVRAFQVENRGGESALLAIEIDRLYVRQFEIDQELKALQPSATGQAAPSPFAPSMMAPVAPATPSAPSPFAPSMNMTSPGAAADTSTDTPAATSEQTGTRRADLVGEREYVGAQIAELEARESGPTAVDVEISLGNFTSMSAVHARIFVATLFYALCVTLLSFFVCYPVAYAVATSTNPDRVALLLLCLVIPYAINELLRIFAWVMILERQGLLNAILDWLGFIDRSQGEGVRFVASNAAVFAVMVYAYILFMVFPIYNTIDTLDRNQIEAARDLGASTWRIHTRIVIPHAKPGIAVGAIMTFMLSSGSIAAPEIVGRGMHPDWFSQVIYRRFFEADSWNQGAAYSLALLVACMIFILVVMSVFKVGIRDIAK
jgi:spermidine/putrescine transport system permease protein